MFQVGDEVFGMLAADRPGSWAEYAIVLEEEVALKPQALSWNEAAAVPLSGMTAFEALFVHARVNVPGDEEALRNRSVLPRAGNYPKQCWASKPGRLRIQAGTAPLDMDLFIVTCALPPWVSIPCAEEVMSL
ncbi:hypothetical protein BDW68DRAFT_179893 [Aspergillus falconensis]